MGIVMNEYEWAERALSERSLGPKPVETLTRVSKYYAANQYPKREIRRLLDEFMLQCDPSVNLVSWSDLLDRLAKNSDRYDLIVLDKVSVTSTELDIIKELKGAQLRRLAFTLLCLAKYWDAVRRNNSHWVNTPDREIVQMANINTSIKRQSLLFGQLRDAGLIRFSRKVDNLSVQVLFIDDESEPEIEVTDFRNLGFQYMMHYGAPYFVCENCGLVTKMKDGNAESRPGRPQKYCPECAATIGMRQRVNWVMQFRGMKS
jgi:hypothetical protein